MQHLIALHLLHFLSFILIFVSLIVGCSKKDQTSSTYDETTATTTGGAVRPNSKSTMDKLRKEDKKDDKKKGQAEYENCGNMTENQLEKMKELKNSKDTGKTQ